MGQTSHYNLYVTDDTTETFMNWREKMNATTNSNMTIIDSALYEKADAVDMKGSMDSPAHTNTHYYLGQQSSLTINIPTDTSVGDEIVVCFSSGSTPCVLTCSLQGFDYTPRANKTSWLKFTLTIKGATSAGDVWVCETKEGG